MKMAKFSEYDLLLRGKLISSNEIELPKEWDEIIDLRSITISITPVGSRQNIIVKRVDTKKVYLENYGQPIECYYHIYANKKQNEST